MAAAAIDTLLFDLGNVLFPYDWGIAIRGLAETLSRPEEALRLRFSHSDYSILFYEFGTGRISKERFCRRFNEHLDADLAPGTIARAWCSIFREDKAMTGLLKRLRNRYRTYILSDTDILHWAYLQERFGVEDWAGGAILSFRQGAMKSDPGAFPEIVRRFQLLPERTVFIDDLEKNLAVARETGIQCVQHVTYDKTVKALKAIGVD